MLDTDTGCVVPRPGVYVMGCPITVAYTGAIAKMQGRTLPHVTICLWAPAPWAPYVGLVRGPQPELVHWLSKPTPGQKRAPTSSLRAASLLFVFPTSWFVCEMATQKSG